MMLSDFFCILKMLQIQPSEKTMFKENSKTKTYLLILVLCSPAILSKLQGILADYQSLLQKADTQRKRLQEQFQLYQFEREFQLVDAWLSSKQSVAESDDYGQDLDDVEVLYVLCGKAGIYLLQILCSC